MEVVDVTFQLLLMKMGRTIDTYLVVVICKKVNGFYSHWHYDRQREY
ncbi:MAG TPA: hypothetical protein VKX40_05150 [Aequorivita sp.]|nr:hypothetical protein [Aequorivita sp.]